MSNITCLNKNHPEVAKMLKFVPNETSLASLIERLNVIKNNNAQFKGENYTNPTAIEIFDYYKKLLNQKQIKPVAFSLRGNEALYKANNLLSTDNKIKTLTQLSEEGLKNWETLLNKKTEYKGTHYFETTDTTVGKKILIYPVLNKPQEGKVEQLPLFDESNSLTPTQKENIANLKQSDKRWNKYNDEDIQKFIDSKEINESEITYTDEDGNLCAKMGMKSDKFTKGGKWELIKEFKGASHERGGIDIEIGKSGIKMSGKQGKFEAKFGLVINKKSLK